MARIVFEVEIDDLKNSQLDEIQDALIKVYKNTVLGKTAIVTNEVDREEDEEEIE